MEQSTNCVCRDFDGTRLALIQSWQRKVTALAAPFKNYAGKTPYALYAARVRGLTRKFWGIKSSRAYHIYLHLSNDAPRVDSSGRDPYLSLRINRPNAS